jgi:hypothetical protein
MKTYIDYAQAGTRMIRMQVRCKGDCPKVLVQRRGPSQNLRLDKTNEYGEIVFEMSVPPHGLLGKHETAMCYDCRQRLLYGGERPGELLAIYAQDVYQWIQSTIAEAGTPLAEAERMAARFVGFVPLRVLQEPSRGDTYYG